MRMDSGFYMKRKIKEEHLIPREGNISTLFERLAEYINISNPDWIHRIQPTEKEDIELLKKVSRIKKMAGDFPESYKIFLNHIGERNGGLINKL